MRKLLVMLLTVALLVLPAMAEGKPTETPAEPTPAATEAPAGPICRRCPAW